MVMQSRGSRDDRQRRGDRDRYERYGREGRDGGRAPARAPAAERPVHRNGGGVNGKPDRRRRARSRARRARRPFFRRRKSCPFSGPNAPKIDYKDVKLLQRFVSERGKIVPSRITAVSTQEAARARAGDQAGAVSRPASLYGELAAAARPARLARRSDESAADARRSPCSAAALGACPYLRAAARLAGRDDPRLSDAAAAVLSPGCGSGPARRH